MKIYREVGSLYIVNRKDNEGYERPVYEIEVDEAEFLVDFVKWLREDGFGEEQFQEIMNTYLNDKGRVS